MKIGVETSVLNRLAKLKYSVLRASKPVVSSKWFQGVEKRKPRHAIYARNLQPAFQSLVVEALGEQGGENCDGVFAALHPSSYPVLR